MPDGAFHKLPGMSGVWFQWAGYSLRGQSGSRKVPVQLQESPDARAYHVLVVGESHSKIDGFRFNRCKQLVRSSTI